MRGEGGGGEEVVHMPEVGLIVILGLEKELKLVPSVPEMHTTLFYLAEVKVKSGILLSGTHNFSCFLWSIKCCKPSGTGQARVISNAPQIAGEVPGVVDCTTSRVAWCHSSPILIFSSEEQD